MKKFLFLMMNLIIVFAINSAQMGINTTTPLRDAIDVEDLNEMQEVINQTGDIEEINSFSGASALMYAIRENKSLKVIQFLVNNGANVMYKSLRNRTPVMDAISYIRLDVLICLLNRLGRTQDLDYLFVKEQIQIVLDLFDTLILENSMNSDSLTYKKMKYVFESYIKFRNENIGQRLKNLFENINNALDNIMPKDLTNIIAGYAEQSFEEYLGDSYENIKD